MPLVVLRRQEAAAAEAVGAVATMMVNLTLTTGHRNGRSFGGIAIRIEASEVSKTAVVGKSEAVEFDRRWGVEDGEFHYWASRLIQIQTSPQRERHSGEKRRAADCSMLPHTLPHPATPCH